MDPAYRCRRTTCAAARVPRSTARRPHPVYPYVRSGAVSLALDYLLYYLFGGVFFVLFGSVKQYKASQKIIGPYRGGRILFSDIFVASIGQCLRNGTMEHALSFTTMLTVMPWIKYYINANPLIYPFKERFVQQISTSLKDIGVDTAHEKAREIISRTRQNGRLAKRLDLWRFCPHRPYPPPGRRWANGLQAANIITLITHVTHGVAEAQGVTEKDQFVLSNCTERPVWRVMLWYSNPYHFLSGWVEASITNGEPSQKDKVHGGEHPMWLVTAASPLLSNRDSVTGPGIIDAFFDSWLPVIVNEIRRLARGAEYAASMHQEVVSKDGLSRPAATVGMDNLAADAPPHKELKQAAAKKRSRLQRALAASIAFSGADKSDSSKPLALNSNSTSSLLFLETSSCENCVLFTKHGLYENTELPPVVVRPANISPSPTTGAPNRGTSPRPPRGTTIDMATSSFVRS